jgi:hypothetical protein
MKKFNNRNLLTPHMKEYSKIGVNWMPFIMFIQKPNHRSTVVNTDSHGFRFNFFNNKINNIFEVSSAKKIVIGNSIAFGVGASSDEKTLSSVLSKKTGQTYLNFGGRAFSGFQDITLFNYFIDKLKDIDEIIIINGVNDLYLVNFSDEQDYLMSLIYNKNKFSYLMNKPRLSLKKKFFNILGTNKNEFSLSSNLNKNQTIESNIERNMFFWSVIKKSLNVKVKMFLQPLANWCKNNLSVEESKIFDELDKNHYNSIQLKKFIGEDHHNFLSTIFKTNCEKFDIEYEDLNKSLIKFNSEKNWLFVDRIHLNDNGIDKVSEIILNK